MAYKRSYSEMSNDVTDKIIDIQDNIKNLEEDLEWAFHNKRIEINYIHKKIRYIEIVCALVLLIVWFLIYKVI